MEERLRWKGYSSAVEVQMTERDQVCLQATAVLSVAALARAVRRPWIGQLPKHSRPLSRVSPLDAIAAPRLSWPQHPSQVLVCYIPAQRPGASRRTLWPGNDMQESAFTSLRLSESRRVSRKPRLAHSGTSGVLDLRPYWRGPYYGVHQHPVPYDYSK
ncbi:hypothetical protein BD309DRAFT_582552 [Dichomitus squalens]|nr:hypothetical protein BD309DRAFT_582552 [Dichomitus squalens]